MCVGAFEGLKGMSSSNRLLCDMETLRLEANLNENVNYSRQDGKDERMELKRSLFQRIIEAPTAFFKNQQRGDPDLSSEEKLFIVENLHDQNVKIFLDRYSKFFTINDLPYLDYISCQKDNSIIETHKKLIISRLMGGGLSRRTSRHSKAELLVKNRRYEKMTRLEREGEYFSEEEMKGRNPLMYEQMIGRYLNDEEIFANVKDNIRGMNGAVSEGCATSANHNHTASTNSSMTSTDNSNEQKQHVNNTSTAANNAVGMYCNDAMCVDDSTDNSSTFNKGVINDNNVDNSNSNNSSNIKNSISNKCNGNLQSPMLSTLLLRHLQVMQNNELYAKQVMFEESCTEEVEEDDEDEGDEEFDDDDDDDEKENDDTSMKIGNNESSNKKGRLVISDGDKLMLRNEFVSSMKQHFLDGKDDFDYSSIDNDPDLDNIEMLDKDMEEQYFDDDDDDCGDDNDSVHNIKDEYDY
ncbi:hypothetical protein HELRODRAFT_189599 [Helobdella robusta]|uniref:CCD97-like C-terminal domain-containing protein n=1 Tax=Helobdella robusta TaxID=6412 RepID=T1FR68_HELRO|nr:hypothetical protein HELRODRAFT_189599 [Helobdella robusta]ESN92746.1 hypothetical protein HELRODRAFT_189599 [Helobdella robusta]